MPDYELTAHAEKDLKRIACYTIETWGLKQAKHYESLLADRFQKIAQSRLAPKPFLSHRSNLLFTLCEHHYIFYCTRADQPPLILAIFHERMDLMQRLKNRLT